MKHVTTLLALVFVTLSFGQGGPQNAQRQGMKRGAHLKEVLNLTEEQYTALASQKKETMAKLKPLREQVRTIRKQMITDYANESKVEQEAQELGDTHGKMALIMAEQLRSVSKILNADQMDKFLQLKENHRKKGGQKGPRQGQKRPRPQNSTM